MDQFPTPFGTLALERIPAAGKQPLRAWDAADELLLQRLAEEDLPAAGAEILLLNDPFAALSCALDGYQRTLYSDSFLSQLALERNQSLNHTKQAARFIPSTQALSGNYSLVIIRVPKALALLEHQLASLRPLLNQHTRIIAAGMVKYLQKNHFALLERYLGPVSTSLAKKKARLIFVDALNTDIHNIPTAASYTDPSSGLSFRNLANVFSRAKPDQGSQLMIRHFNSLEPARCVIDMGCGNGILGINLKRRQPDIEHISFVDESFMALESSRINYQTAFANTDAADFIASNCFEQITSGAPDLVLCNPPFHQLNSVGDHIAWSMISQSRDCLAAGGRLCLVGNRHLNYHSKIKHVFGNVELLASDRRFVVLTGRKTHAQ